MIELVTFKVEQWHADNLIGKSYKLNEQGGIANEVVLYFTDGSYVEIGLLTDVPGEQYCLFLDYIDD